MRSFGSVLQKSAITGVACLWLLFSRGVETFAQDSATDQPWIRVADDKRSFVCRYGDRRLSVGIQLRPRRDRPADRGLLGRPNGPRSKATSRR